MQRSAGRGNAPITRPVIPLLRPAPARLSRLAQDLEQIEDAAIFSNSGPINEAFERRAAADLFGGQGHCVTMCNATLALVLMIKQAVAGQAARRRYALMPSFTFAATAQAALWAGLTPLLCDIDPDTWTSSRKSEADLLERHGNEVAVIVGCTTFGNPIELAHYRTLAERHGCALVIDAAASLGTTDANGRQFGAGFPEPVVYSMHATKPFATLEGALIHTADLSLITALRAMANFGFTESRSASLPGLNAKLNEVTALMALAKLKDFPSIVARRYARDREYRALLSDFTWQRMQSHRYAPTFGSVLLPRELAWSREDIRRAMLAEGVRTGTYFSPHLAGQPYFKEVCVWSDLSVSDDVARRIVTLPMYDELSSEDVVRVAAALRQACDAATPAMAPTM